MASTNAEANSLRNSARAAWSNFMGRSFRALGSTAACRSVPHHPAEPIADAREHDDIGGEHGAAQQRYLLLERLAFGTAVRARAQTALHEIDERNIDQRRNDRTDDGTEEPGKRQIDHAVAP